MKDPVLWLLIGIAFGVFLRWAHDYYAEIRRIREETERIERENTLMLMRLLAIAAQALESIYTILRALWLEQMSESESDSELIAREMRHLREIIEGMGGGVE